MNSTDANWFPTFTSDPDKIFKQITLTGFSITLNIHEEYQTSKTTKVKFQDELFSKSDKPHLERQTTTTIREEESYILFPMDFNIKIKQQLDLSQDFSKRPQLAIIIDVKEPFIFMLNKKHMQYLGSLNEHLRVMTIVSKNIHLRPRETPLANPSAWWVYAFNAITEGLKTTKCLVKNTTNLMKMRRYIDIYKRQQSMVIIYQAYSNS